MRVVIVKNDQIAAQLERIGDILENLLMLINEPVPPTYEMDDDPQKNVFYTNENTEIIREKLRQLGKEYKEPKS